MTASILDTDIDRDNEFGLGDLSGIGGGPSVCSPLLPVLLFALGDLSGIGGGGVSFLSSMFNACPSFMLLLLLEILLRFSPLFLGESKIPVSTDEWSCGGAESAVSRGVFTFAFSERLRLRREPNIEAPVRPSMERGVEDMSQSRRHTETSL